MNGADGKCVFCITTEIILLRIILTKFTHQHQISQCSILHPWNVHFSTLYDHPAGTGYPTGPIHMMIFRKIRIWRSAPPYPEGLRSWFAQDTSEGMNAIYANERAAGWNPHRNGDWIWPIIAEIDKRHWESVKAEINLNEMKLINKFTTRFLWDAIIYMTLYHTIV